MPVGPTGTPVGPTSRPLRPGLRGWAEWARYGFSGVERRHGGEGVSLEGRAADEAAVDVGLSHELLDVVGLGGAAVEDARGLGGLVGGASLKADSFAAMATFYA